jgi:hypothetical protein
MLGGDLRHGEVSAIVGPALQMSMSRSGCVSSKPQFKGRADSAGPAVLYSFSPSSCQDVMILMLQAQA